ncbi:ubiquitin carboxyl-terminal hydrolase 7 [Ditylenchus destructor]|nr:ubiquitin carboxyl-terminal hydrolase 7 [Ditylenchus destructor]
MSEWRERTETVSAWKPERQLLTAFEADDKGFYKSEGSIEMRIDRFAEFVRDGKWRWSAPTYIRGLPWKIISYSGVNSSDQSNNHSGQSPSKDLGIFLNCNNDSDSQTWECQAIVYTACQGTKRGCQGHNQAISRQ